MMQGLREFGNALAVALISITLMVGALSISLVEFVPEAAPTPTNMVLPSPMPVTATATLPPSATPLPGLVTPTLPPSATFTNIVVANCPYPAGWMQYSIQSNDTLDSLAALFRIGKNDLMRGNCLISEALVAGKVLYVPPGSTSTVVTCTQGASGWLKNYTVKSGDTFYAIASNYSTTAGLLKHVNCRISDLIFAGELLWVPNVPTRTPFPTPLPGSTVTPHPTDPLTETALPFTVTVIPSETPIPATETPAPTLTPVPTPTPTLTPFP